MRPSSAVFIWVQGLAVVAAGAAVAQSEAEDALIREGLSLRAQGRDTEALPILQRAREASRSPRATAQLGMVEQAVGRWVDADRHLREALRAAGDPWVTRTRPVLEQALGDIAQHVGRLELIGGVDGARVRVDGREAGVWPLAEPLTVPAGRVLLEVEAAGYHPLTREVVVRAGAEARESLDLVALPPPPPARLVVTPPMAPTQRTPSPDRRAWRAWSYVGFGVGGAFVVGGAVSLVLWQSNVSRFNGTTYCGQVGEVAVGGADCEGWLRDGALARTLGVVGLAVGGAALVASTVTFVLSGAARSRPAQTWSCGPTFTAPGVACAWRL